MDETPAGHSRARVRPYPFRAPIAAWTAVLVLAALAAFAAGTAALYRGALERTRDQRESRAHASKVAAARTFIDSQVDDTVTGLKAMYTAGAGMPMGSEQLKALELSAGVSSLNRMLPLTMVGTGNDRGQWTGVGISGVVGQIGISEAGDGTLDFSPYGGGPVTKLPNWRLSDRSWFKAGYTRPDVVQAVGPTAGLDNRTYYTLAIGSPNDRQVWMFATSADTLGKFAAAGLNPSDDGAAAVVIDHRVALPLRDAAVKPSPYETLWASKGLPGAEVQSVAQSLDGRGSLTRRVDGRGGREWLVSVGRVFPDNATLLWAYASPVGRPVLGGASQEALLSLLLGLVLVLAAAALSTVSAVRLRRLAGRIEGATTPEGVAELAATRDWVSEYNTVTAATLELADDAERALSTGARRLAQVSRLHLRSLQLRSDERNRLALELHDGPLQDVLALKLSGAGDGDGRTGAVLDSAAGELRRITTMLSTSELGPGGLAEALRDTASSLAEPGVFDVDLDVGPVPEPDAAAAGVVVRAARELSVNARKHSGTRRVRVHLAGNDETLRLVVEDDGLGFEDPDAAVSRSFGLLSLKVQAEALGGTLELGRSASGGASAALTVPARPAAGGTAAPASDDDGAEGAP